PPRVAIVLGSGLAGIARRLERARSISFAELPGVEPTSVAGHTGVLFAGEWAGRPVLIFGGRLHFYEGRTWDQVVAPMGFAASLGARLLVLTNAAGGIHEALGPGSLMGIRDHLEWARPNRWQLGTGLSPYSGRLLHGLSAAAAELGITLRQGVYAAVTGPCYETPAEIRALEALGADAVGMSTAREAHAACDLGLECAGISCVTNRAAGLSPGPIRHDEVLTTAAAQSDRLADLLERFLSRLE